MAEGPYRPITAIAASSTRNIGGTASSILLSTRRPRKETSVERPCGHLGLGLGCLIRQFFRGWRFTLASLPLVMHRIRVDDL